MAPSRVRFVATALAALVFSAGLVALLASTSSSPPRLTKNDQAINANGLKMINDGRQIFRYDTFGDEAFWTGVLRINEPLRSLTPRKALSLGLKVDSDALSSDLINKIRAGQVNLDDPAVTAALLKANAVLGVTGTFRGSQLAAVGFQCALCHSTVDNSVAPGIGHRLDGWANRDLNVGAIIASSPNVAFLANLLGVSVSQAKNVFLKWGPGKFDAELLLDGKGFQPDGRSAATLIPPAFGLAGVNNHTWTGAWGTVTYWNAFVANLELRGKGVFFDPRLDNAAQYPVAAAHPELFGHKTDEEDLITPKLPALHVFQLAIPAPQPPEGSLSASAAARGELLFDGKAKCTTCHVEPITTEPGWNLRQASEICIDSFQADRAPDHRYRTSPLNGLWTHTKGGFYHDGRFATLLDVVNHYNTCLNLHLSSGEKSDIVEYLKALPEPETNESGDDHAGEDHDDDHDEDDH